MKKYILLLPFLLSLLQAHSQRFEVSKNQRYLTKDGLPFLWLGDTAWELFHRCSIEEAKEYFSKRKEQGFTVIQSVVLAELDGLNVPNTNGDLPFENGDILKVNDAYFDHVEAIITLAETYDMTIGLLPTWGDKVYREKWGTGPEIFNVDNAYTYGKWLSARLNKHPNIIWIMGGDRNPRKDSNDADVWRSMAKGITDAYENPQNAIMTFHPQPNREGANEWFHNDTWLDFNMFQTGHCRDLPVYENIALSYNRRPIKPVINGEPIYEDHPVCFNAQDLGYTSAYDVRKAAYLSLFAGAFGHTYGCHAVWQMYTKERYPINGPLKNWKESLDLSGANQIKHISTLFKSIPFHELVPDQTLVLEKNKKSYDRIQACRGKDFALVYTASGSGFSANVSALQGSQFEMKWYNPRSGEWSTPIPFNKAQRWMKCSPREAGYGKDWVLMIYKVK
jgi:hypothetical protein